MVLLVSPDFNTSKNKKTRWILQNNLWKHIDMCFWWRKTFCNEMIDVEELCIIVQFIVLLIYVISHRCTKTSLYKNKKSLIIDFIKNNFVQTFIGNLYVIFIAEMFCFVTYSCIFLLWQFETPFSETVSSISCHHFWHRNFCVKVMDLVVYVYRMYRFALH